MTVKHTLLVTALLWCAVPLALAQGGPKTPAPAVIEILGADMAPSCRDGDVERARKLAAACNGKTQCRFVPEAADAAGEACLRQSQALWSCGDGRTREAKLAVESGQSREISLACPQPVATVAASGLPPASAQPAAADTTETIKVEQTQRKTMVEQQAARMAPLDASAQGVDRERLRTVCELFTDPAAPENSTARLNQLHAEVWNRPDHSAAPIVDQCLGAKTDVPGSARPTP